VRTVERYGLKITIFSTHASTLLSRPPAHVEVGLHPDFTRPNTVLADKMTQLRELYPAAVGMRSHRNFFGQNIGDLAVAAGLKYDASVFLWNEPFCQAHYDYNNMLRFSYMWEDGIHLDMGLGLAWDKVNLRSPGLKILNVHPILIYLNSSTEEHRRSVTKRYHDLQHAPQSQILPEVNKGRGIATVWEEMLRWIADNGIRSHLLSEAWAAADKATTRQRS
jgi:hypothetical protein